MASPPLGALATFAAAVPDRLGAVRIRAQSLKLRAEAVQEMWVRRAESKVSTAAPGLTDQPIPGDVPGAKVGPPRHDSQTPTSSSPLIPQSRAPENNGPFERGIFLLRKS